MLNLIDFYHFSEPGIRYSYFNRLDHETKQSYIDSLRSSSQCLVEILAFAIMPNHIHFLLKQSADKGISNFMRFIQNGFAKYTNIKAERTGSVFQSMFKAVRVESDEQLLHVGRYIHLNPVTGYVLADIKALARYPWNSYSGYLGTNYFPFLSTNELLGYFKDGQEFMEFTESRADYQRDLKEIEHLVLE